VSPWFAIASAVRQVRELEQTPPVKASVVFNGLGGAANTKLGWTCELLGET
jgi:hypothetical protein